ncbi:hypothetical protein CALVIDRAFT_318790 [Calocera viscosa TUFC12733]|uniref:Uncharacterized protein n=1 Tax=Calocera viscosa (strain TUFC12733) TaxID=1330018 RepID=A0A167HY14_CALVF|nr:hypothetical protein CALVIDRAFT_318790 [Calocera viscosa TUFC12733]
MLFYYHELRPLVRMAPSTGRVACRPSPRLLSCEASTSTPITTSPTTSSRDTSFERQHPSTATRPSTGNTSPWSLCCPHPRMLTSGSAARRNGQVDSTPGEASPHHRRPTRCLLRASY